MGDCIGGFPDARNPGAISHEAFLNGLNSSDLNYRNILSYLKSEVQVPGLQGDETLVLPRIEVGKENYGSSKFKGWNYESADRARTGQVLCMRSRPAAVIRVGKYMDTSS